MSRELGTRHRAAIGLTEENDAVAVVVSEETGQIALAIDGRIERGLTPDALRERLRALVRCGDRRRQAGARATTSRCRDLHPFRHLGLKVMAVALATLLWLTVAGDHLVERSMRVPLEFRNMPQTLEIVGDPPTRSTSGCAGRRRFSAASSRARSSRSLDLGSARPGSRMFHMRNDEVRSPYGVEVAQVVPGTIALEMEKSGRRTVPVVPALEGEPAPGFVLGQDRRPIRHGGGGGAGEPAAQLTGATTEPVDVSGARPACRDVVTVGIADSAVRLVKAQNARVTVEILPGAGRARADRRARAVAQPGRGLARAAVAGADAGHRARAADALQGDAAE